MPSFLFQQWTKSIETSTALLQQFTEPNISSTKLLMQGVYGLRDYAQFSKSLITFYTEYRKSNEYILNNLLQSQLSLLNPQALATATREVGENLTNSVERTIQNQLELVKIYVEANANYLEALANAQTSLDLTTAALKLSTDIQKKSKENVLEGLAVVKGTETAISGWAEATMNAMSAEPVAAGSSSEA